jgi:hypothetical protein
MAHEMIEEGKLLKMIYSVLHDSLLATETSHSATTPGNSTTIGATNPDNSTTIGKSATETAHAPPTQYTDDDHLVRQRQETESHLNAHQRHSYKET